MAIPSLVIGLGGTGQWVLTYLKNDLQEANGGEMPKDVQLLGIDTQLSDVQLLKAGAQRDGDQRMNTLTDAQVGAVRLDKISEYFQIGEPLYDFILRIHRQDPKPEEFAWLDTDYLIGLGPGPCSTIYGAGAFRQLGRLSLFNKVDLLYNRLQQAISRGSNATANRVMNYGGGQNQAMRMEIIIVTSLAGGTGAGIFMDVAWLVRAAAEAMNYHYYKLTGYFVMPTAWEQQGHSTDKRLRAYAAWQELNRFMLPPVEVNNPTRIVYLPNTNPPLAAEYDRRVFDNAYIIDPDRTGNSLTAFRPEDATYPVVAQAISGSLDDTLGQLISLDNSNNDTAIGTLPRGVYYSSVGAFTFKTPVHFTKSQMLNEYRLATLEQLIAPNYGPSGEAIGVRRDRNTEATPATVEAGARAFLSSAQHHNIDNNALLPEIQTVSGKGEELNMHVINEANKIVNRNGGTFTAFTTHVNDADLQTRLTQLVNENIWHVVRPSGDRPNATPWEIKQEVLNGVEVKDVEWFGQWGNVPDPRNPGFQIQTRITEGTKVRLLREAGDAIVRNFRALLKEWSAIQLNGLDNDPVKAKSGKLGYLLGVYEELNKKFDAYLNYLNLLNMKIAENNTRVRLSNARDAARRNYDKLAGKECVFAFFDNNVHPHAREAERTYLRTTNKLFEYYLSESIITESAAVVRAMQRFTLESKKKLEEWVMVLATGKQDGDPDKRFNSLYNYGWGIVRTGENGLQAEIRRGNPSFANNRQLRGVQQMLDTQVADNHYQENNRVRAFGGQNPQPLPYQATQEIKDGLNAFVWGVTNPAGSDSLEFSLGVPGGSLIAAQTNDAVVENYNKLNSVLNARYDNALQGNQGNVAPIIDILSHEFQDVQAFAQDLKNLTKPLYQTRQGGGIVYKRNSMFMRLDGSTDPAYFVNLENQVNAQLVSAKESINRFNNAGNNSLSSDPYKFTYLQLHHLIPSREFVLLNDMEELFQSTMAVPNQIVSPKTNYVFNAERNAHDLALMRTIQRTVNFSPFEPEIVGLLENTEKVRMFFQAYAQGLLVYKDGMGVGNTEWKLLAQDGMPEVVIFDKDETGLSVDKKSTVYEVINYWLSGKDARPDLNLVNRIDWNKLRSLIRNEEIGTGMSGVINAYREQIDETNPDSIVSLIRNQADARSQAIQVINQIYYQDKMFNDLIDLAKVILTERINALEAAQRSQGNYR